MMFPTNPMPSFSITRNEAALGASAPAITRPIPAPSKAWRRQARDASVARPLPGFSRQLVAELRLLHALEADEAAEAQEVFAPAHPDAEQADALLGEHAGATGDDVLDRRLRGQASLPHPAHTGQRQERHVRSPQEARHLGDPSLAPHQRRGGVRQGGRARESPGVPGGGGSRLYFSAPGDGRRERRSPTASDPRASAGALTVCG